MSNRQQRRAAMKKGKRQGETYADVLEKKRMIREAVERSVHNHAVTIDGDIKGQRVLWMSILALNRAFGFWSARSQRYLSEMEDVAKEFEAEAKEHGAVVAVAHLMDQAGKITGVPFSPIHEEEMRQARIANEAEGVFFPEDDPDRW